MKKKVLIIISVLILIAIAIGGAYSIDMYRMKNNKPVVFSSWGYDYAPPEEQNDFSLNNNITTINEYDEAVNPDKEQNETPLTGEQSFVGTIVEETNTSLVVVPNADEIERTLGERITVKILEPHKDFLYGEGRKIVVYYDASSIENETTITALNISVDGFIDFELSVDLSKQKRKDLILRSDEIDKFTSFGHISDTNLYYYGLSEVNVFVDNQTIPLVVALEKGKLTLNAIIQKANIDVANGIIEEISYDDGGSSVFKYPNYTIIKYHTLDGNRDVYIGSSDMDIHIADK